MNILFRRRRLPKKSRKFLTKPSPWLAIVFGSIAILFTLNMGVAIAPMFEPIEYDPTPTWPPLSPSHPMATPTHYPMMPPTPEPTDEISE